MILIVDDLAENLFSLKTLLQHHAYEVDTASSGEEALKKLLRKEYSLIILDVQMPDMDGYEVAEAVNSLNKTRDIPIIFLSAVNTDKRFVNRGYQSGGVDYLPKPFDPDLLLLKVKTFVRLYEQTHELKQVQDMLHKEIESRKRAQAEVESMNLSLEEKITQRTRELIYANQDLENRNTELAQYAYLASHDLQEPLRKILLFSKVIREKHLAETPEAQTHIDKVISSAERMRDLIQDLLSHSNLSGTSSFTRVDMNDVIENTLSDLEVVLQEKNAQITLEKMPVLEAVPGQMRQLFQNLISNALKFSKPDSAPQILMQSELIATKDIDAAPDPKGHYARIQVIDNGIGFDEAYRDKIFTIFQRLHGRSEYEGTGIGLAIVKKIVEKHNGLIGAKSQEGEGAAFTIILPLYQTVSAQLPG